MEVGLHSNDRNGCMVPLNARSPSSMDTSNSVQIVSLRMAAMAPAEMILHHKLCHEIH